MPIIEYTTSPVPTVVQMCAFCQARRDYPLTSLRLGTEGHPGEVNPCIIMFEPCPCGGSEGVFCHPTESYLGTSRTEVHGRFVLALGRHLREQGQIHPLCHEAVDALPPFGAELEPIKIHFPV